MKFFIDTAKIEEIREAKMMGLVDGVTTNPSLVSQTGRTFEEVVRDIVAEVDGPISLEAVSTQAEEIIAEGRKLATYGKNVVIKCPLTVDGLKACRALTSEGIGVNVTLCFSPSQALLAAKANATYISPFIGRLDDISHHGMELVRQILTIYRNYQFKTQVLVASIRHPLHVVEAALLGADVATIPFAVIKRLVNHPLTDVGIERFLKDWQKVPG
ncbi:MAG: fructose-6-phosphate aldolase [Bradymonadales bacterium]|nr:fructose-6-phosphate aldolase [Bradymonadales bacterium]